MKQRSLLHQSLMMALLILATAIYWPGLSGPFLFDDFANIDTLGAYGGVRNWETFKLFVFGNHSGPTGRPIAMLSFLLNATNWPTDPWPFKFTNLLIHLVNGLLLFSVTIKLLQLNGYPKNLRFWAAFLTSAFWLLHPFNVSTVLYPVQRMALLATLFVLLGLIGYLHGRSKLNDDPKAAYWWMSISLIAGTVCATFSKENGALLPIMVLVIEVTILSRLSTRPAHAWLSVFLYMPLVLLIVYFSYSLSLGNIQNAYYHREFTLHERLLTQPRVLFDYLYYWYIPHIGSPGLLTQNFPISKDIFNPPTTLLSIIGLSIATLSAIVFRRRFGILSMAILFFLAGHLLESTIIPLEIYFEHRNYLPAIFLALPLTTGILSLGRFHKYWLYLGTLLIFIPALLTSQRADIWADEESLAYHWATVHPDSQRAQRHAALVAHNAGKYTLALDIMSRAKQQMPDHIAVYLHWLTLKCRTIPITPHERMNTLDILEKEFYSFKNYDMLSSTIQFIASSECLGGGIDLAMEMISALERNTNAIKSAGARHQLHSVRGLLQLSNREYGAAANSFRLAQEQMQQAESGLLQVSMLAGAGQYNLALRHLNYVESFILKRYAQQETGKLDFLQEAKHLRKTLMEDIANSSINVY